MPPVDPPDMGCTFEFGFTPADAAAFFGGVGDAGEVIVPRTFTRTLNADDTLRSFIQAEEGFSVPLVNGSSIINSSNTPIVSFELQLSLPALDGIFSDSLQLVAFLLAPPAVILGVSVEFEFDTGDYVVKTDNNTLFTLGASGDFRLGVDINFTSGEVTVSDGTNLVTVSLLGAAPGLTLAPGILMDERLSNPVHTGKVLTAEFVVEQENFTLQHIEGSVAVCEALTPLMPIVSDPTYSDVFQDPDPLKNGGGFYTIRPPAAEAPSAFSTGNVPATMDGLTLDRMRNIASGARGQDLGALFLPTNVVIHDLGVLSGKLGQGDGTPTGELATFFPVDNSGAVVPNAEGLVEQAPYTYQPYEVYVPEILEATSLVFGNLIQGTETDEGSTVLTGAGTPIVFGQAYKFELTGVDDVSGENLYRTTLAAITGGPPDITVTENVPESAVDFTPLDLADDGQTPPVQVFSPNEELLSLIGFPYWLGIRQLSVTRYIEGEELTALINRLLQDPL